MADQAQRGPDTQPRGALTMVLDANGEDEDLDDLDRALAAGMEESRPIYAILSGDALLEDDEVEREETLEGPA